ncbi:DUF2336 domain-containing protein [Sphingomonas aracearum]|uniref:DUF2336 domain-containing protein n=1 Tax=Sphingomonas aracearum TaxID=2283317 RepID=A0A369VUU0_9SPHN|nr:DUF2336 domain-containing protein [Sphingomonas aracearum]RDE05327.1 DUF2336 domain-containing protein [Sphingomonas aracearum]
MSIDPRDPQALLTRAARADARAASRLATAIDDFFLPDVNRLDDRTRAAIGAAMARVVGAVEQGIAQHAARLLAGRGAPEAATALLAAERPVLDRLAHAGLLRDVELMREIEARVRQDLLSDALPGGTPEGDAAGLLARLAAHSDAVIARAATALVEAEGRRRFGSGTTELPAELHHRLVWWTAAALRERVERPDAPLDRALAEAATRSLSAHDEADRAEAIGLRLAAAIDADAAQLADLLPQALDDRRLALFVALLAHALGVDYAEARALALDPEGDRLWLVLRALEIGREAIARIGLALAEGDPRRDLDAFADRIDVIAATPADIAREAVAGLRLHPDFRGAMLALARRPTA